MTKYGTSGPSLTLVPLTRPVGGSESPTFDALTDGLSEGCTSSAPLRFRVRRQVRVDSYGRTWLKIAWSLRPYKGKGAIEQGAYAQIPHRDRFTDSVVYDREAWLAICRVRC